MASCASCTRPIFVICSQIIFFFHHNVHQMTNHNYFTDLTSSTTGPYNKNGAVQLPSILCLLARSDSCWWESAKSAELKLNAKIQDFLVIDTVTTVAISGNEKKKGTSK